MSSFFTIPSSQKKRKRTGVPSVPKKRVASSAKPSSRAPKPTSKRKERDESISGSDDEDSDGGAERGRLDVLDGVGQSESEASDEEETAAERRLRLAERYLENVRGEVGVDDVGFDAEEIDRDLIAERLQEDAAESKGRMYRALAGELDLKTATHAWGKYNGQSITGVATCGTWMYTVGKGVELVKWRIQDLPVDQWSNKSINGKKKKKRKSNLIPKPPPKKRPEQVKFVRGDKLKAKDNAYKGHTDIILCVAASQDGKFVATGGNDRKIVIWEAATLKVLRVFNQHRDAVTALAFRRGTNQMYSASKDRTIKIWSLDELAYVETLFGHQDCVVDIAGLAQERCISVGARDRTARLWKVVEETQLVFRGGGGEKKSKSSTRSLVLEGSMDRVAMIDEEMFVTGGDNGSLSLWTMHKKKPIFTLSQAHGMDPPLTPEKASAETNPDPKIVPQPQPRWITALTTIPYSDVILSGSWDGQVRAWRVSEDKKKIERMGPVGLPGVLESPKANGTLKTDAEAGANGVNNINRADQAADGAVVRGIINDISVIERGDRGQSGICIALAVGKEHRFGRWKKIQGRNAVAVLEVSKFPKNEGANGGMEVEAVEAVDE